MQQRFVTFNFFLSFLSNYEFFVFFNFSFFFKAMDNSFVSSLPAALVESPTQLDDFINTELPIVEILKELPQDSEKAPRAQKKESFFFKKYLTFFFFKRKRFFNRLKNINYGRYLFFKNFFFLKFCKLQAASVNFKLMAPKIVKARALFMKNSSFHFRFFLFTAAITLQQAMPVLKKKSRVQNFYKNSDKALQKLKSSRLSVQIESTESFSSFFTFFLKIFSYFFKIKNFLFLNNFLNFFYFLPQELSTLFFDGSDVNLAKKFEVQVTSAYRGYP